jgi:hypothetical protein
MKNIFIVTSCLQPSFQGYNVINFEDRYTQTIETFDSVRRQTKDSLIVFSDSSVHPLDDWKMDVIKSKVDIFLDFSKNEQAQEINKHGLKSVGENFLLLSSIHHLKSLYDFTTMQGRMFKLGARVNLQDSFDLKDYDNCYGKYVFKKRLNSWMPEEIQNSYGSTHILETRLYSWCFSLIDEYIQVIHKNFELFNRGLDTEHSHLINIPSDKLLEYDMVNTGCVLALNGEYMLD